MKKTKYYTLLILLAISFQSLAQQKNNFYPVLNTLNSDEVIVSTTSNTKKSYIISEQIVSTIKIIRAYEKLGENFKRIFIKKFPLSTQVNCSKIYKDILYLGGKNIGGQFLCLTKVVNRELIKVGDFRTLKGSPIVNSLEVINDELFVGGSFNEVKGKRAYNIISYNANVWTNQSLDELLGTSGKVHEIKNFNNQLFVTGNFNNIWNFSNKKWSEYINSSKIKYNLLAFYKDSLYASSDTSKVISILWNGFLKKNIKIPTAKITSMVVNVYDNKLWISRIEDGKTTGFLSLWDGVKQELVSSNVIGSLKLHSFNNNIYCSNVQSIKIDTKNSKAISNPLLSIHLGKLAVISGRIFNDLNKNCKYDIEPKAQNFIQIKSTSLPRNSDRLIRPNQDGYFVAFLVGSISYEISAKLRNAQKTCTYQNIKLDYGSIHNINIAVKPDLNYRDLGVKFYSVSGPKATLKSREMYILKAVNEGGNLESGTLKLKYNTKLKNISANPKPDRLNRGILEWDFKNLNSESSFDVRLFMDVDDQRFSIDDSINFEAEVISDATDVNNNNDNNNLYQEVVINTNDIAKYVFPTPNPGETVSIIDSVEELISYQITFENTTNDTINQVEVIDTLDINLGMEYIQRTGSSHDYSFNAYNNPQNREQAILVWKFNNINLPPKSGNSEQVDHKGFLYFDVKMNPKTTVGTIVSNKAFITMDYTYNNTNPVYFKYDNTVSIENPQNISNLLKIYPNPVNNILRINKLTHKNLQLKLFSLVGKEVYSIDKIQQTESISTKDLKNGIYILQVNGLRTTAHTKLIIKH